MDLTRRQVLVMSAFAAASFSSVGKLLAAGEQKVLDVGELSEYAKEGIYPAFGPKGVFLIRKGNRLVAQSSICTHKRCKLTAQPDGFICKCHNSAFALDGKVTRPPAREDLSRYPLELDEKKHVLVDLGKSIKRDKFDSSEAYLEMPVG